jgi:hypothetical protein
MADASPPVHSSRTAKHKPGIARTRAGYDPAKDYLEYRK